MAKKRSRDWTFAVAAAPRRFWRSERGATIVEYGIVAAMAATALGAIDAPVDRTAIACAGVERHNGWLDKDAVTHDSCAAGRSAGPARRV
ncbi:MAG TPA: hypothetical protein VJL90_06265 [Pseudorhodoplanes sp.]|nr:hypothetical protein [Pseudorhodoplanes sp.]